MRKFFKLFFVILIGLTASSVQAQSFPASEKETSEILCAGKWALDSVGKGAKMSTAADAMMNDVVISFKADGTYTITFFGKDKSGKWATDINGKKVNIFDKTTEPESIVKSLTKDRMEMAQASGEDDFRLIFKPAK